MARISLQLDGSDAISRDGSIEIVAAPVAGRHRPLLGLAIALMTALVSIGALGPRDDGSSVIAEVAVPADPRPTLDSTRVERPLPVAGLRVRAIRNAVVVSGVAEAASIVDLELLVGRIRLSSHRGIVHAGRFEIVMPIETGSTPSLAEVAVRVEGIELYLPVRVVGSSWREWVDPATGMTVRQRVRASASDARSLAGVGDGARVGGA